MFKKLVPVISALLIAGPVFAADTTAPSTDQSASAPAKTHKKHHSKKKSKSAAGADQSAAPKQ